MFAPAEGLSFGIDLSLNARFLPNELALRIARKRIQDADQIMRAESDGEQGVSDLAYERTQQARDLLAHLQASSRPPLLRATLAIAVAADSEEALEQRVEMCRRAYGEIRLHRPLGDQLELFLQHLPAQRTRVQGYDDTLTTEQVAAMMPTATHAVGSRRGFYLGHTLTGSMQPILFDLAEASEHSRPPTILKAGTLGSGKTIGLEGLYYQAFMAGSRIVDIDPKGDHHLDRLPGIDGHLEQIELSASVRWRGLLDPLRIGAPEIRFIGFSIWNRPNY